MDAFFAGLPPTLKRAEYDRLRQVYLDHKAGKLPASTDAKESED